MMKSFYVYIHLKPNGTPFYIGKGCGKRSHKLCDRKNPYYENIIAKYGKENIEILVFPQDSEQSAFDTEVKWIKVLRGAGFKLTNKSDGGEGTSGCHWTLSDDVISKMSIIRKNISDDTREKMSASQKEKWKNPESRAKMRASMIGNKNSVGRIHSAETCAKMSSSRMGRKAWNKGKHLSKEHRDKLSIAGKGKSTSLGCHWTLSSETKQKMSIAKKAMWAKRKLNLESCRNTD